MILRDLSPRLLQAAEVYPVVTLTGPRQSGKTTLVRHLFPNHTYCNLENPEIRTLARDDPKGFFAMYPGALIIDEVQRVPELLSWIQVRSDEQKAFGQYILTGSHQLRLHEAIAQSLAGRTALLRLLPFSCRELSTAGTDLRKSNLIVKGFMPRIYSDAQEPTAAYRNFFQTYVERDVRQLIRIKDISAFERFMKLLAGRVGQQVNLKSLSSDCGVSAPTLGEWLSILEASFIIFRLSPLFNNFSKRLIKAPKLYFIEPGLAAWLLGIESPEQCDRDPLHGNLFENLVIVEALKERLNRGKDPNLFYFRDSNGNEVDLIIEHHRRPVPIEIKSAMTWNDTFVKGLRWFHKTAPESLNGRVIYAGDFFPRGENWRSMSFTEMHGLFNDIEADKV